MIIIVEVIMIMGITDTTIFTLPYSPIQFFNKYKLDNNNGLLRRDGLTKQLDFRNLPDELVIQLMSKRNNLPLKSLGYRTPYEVFMSYVTDEQLFSF